MDPARADRAGRPLRGPDARESPRLHPGSGALARDRHRRQYGALHADQHGDLEAAAGRRSRASADARPAVSDERHPRLHVSAVRDLPGSRRRDRPRRLLAPAARREHRRAGRADDERAPRDRRVLPTTAAAPGARPALRRERRPRPDGTSGRRTELRLLATPLRLGSGSRRPDDHVGPPRRSRSSASRRRSSSGPRSACRRASICR